MMSICAQIEQRHPELATPDAHPRTRAGRLARQTGGAVARSEREKIVIVLDGLDAIDPLSRHRLRDYLPAHVADGATYLASTSTPEALHDLTDRSHHIVLDLGEERWHERGAMLEYASRRNVQVDLSRFTAFDRWTWLAVKILADWSADPAGALELATTWAALENLEDMIKVAVELALRNTAVHDSVFPVAAVSREAIPQSDDVIPTFEQGFESLPAGARALLVRQKSSDGDLVMPVSTAIARAMESSAPSLSKRSHQAVLEQRDRLPRDYWLRQGLYHALSAEDHRLIQELSTDLRYMEERIALEGTGHLIDELSGVPAQAAGPAEPRGERAERPPRLFLCYRRDDTEDAAGRLHDSLVAAFGSDRVLMDLDSVPPGVDFHDYLTKELANVSALVVVIGRNWLSAADRFGTRLDRDTDVVRLEIRTALQRNIPIIPVLVQNASMPPAEALPEDIRPLARRNGLVPEPARWREDTDRLVKQLERLMTGGARQERPSRGGGEEV